MEFGILGPLRVCSGGRVLDLGAPAQRALLAILLASPGTLVTDDRLIDGLWADEPPQSARHLVRVYVSRLRAVLDDAADEGRIVRDGPGYLLRVNRGELDAARFEDAVERRPCASPGGAGCCRANAGRGDAPVAWHAVRGPPGPVARRARAGGAPRASPSRGARSVDRRAAAARAAPGARVGARPDRGGPALRRGAARPAHARPLPMPAASRCPCDGPRARDPPAAGPRDRSIPGDQEPLPRHPAPGAPPRSRAAGAAGQPPDPVHVVRGSDARAPRGGCAPRRASARHADRPRRDREDPARAGGGPAALDRTSPEGHGGSTWRR